MQSNRGVLVIAPDNTLRASIMYPTTVGRNFSEVLRLVECLQLTEETSTLTMTPPGWYVCVCVCVCVYMCLCLCLCARLMCLCRSG